MTDLKSSFPSDPDFLAVFQASDRVELTGAIPSARPGPLVGGRARHLGLRSWMVIEVLLMMAPLIFLTSSRPLSFFMFVFLTNFLALGVSRSLKLAV